MKPDQPDAGRLFTLAYALFALAAGARALYQIATRWHEAPVAFGLSALAALIYLLACVGLQRRSIAGWWLTVAVCLVELVGVLTVGALTTFYPALLTRATVWSQFGAGYGYIPLVLPLAGVVWLLRPQTRARFGV